MSIKKLILFITISMCLVFAFAACSDDDSGSTETTRSESQTRTSEDTGVDEDLIGTWEGDAADLFAANTANLGSTGALDCSGTITVKFTENKSEGTGDVSCTVAGSGMSADGELSWLCDSATEGSTLINTNCESSGSFNFGGTEQDTPEVFDNGEGEYSISGDTLTITFEEESVGKITQTYTRVA